MEAVQVLYEDDDAIVVSKPSGLFVHRTKLGPDRDVLLQRVRDHVGQPVFAVHRIDRATSGAVLFTKSREAVAPWADALSEGTKTYVGLVRGIPAESGVWDRPLSHPKHKRPQVALTEFERVCVVLDKHAIMKFRIRTGRHHQIRRHLNHAGHHLIGDSKHGKGWLNKWFREEHGLPRMALHAWSIEVVHPVSKRNVGLTAPLPDDLRAFFDRLSVFVGPNGRTRVPTP